ncbi:hypothetical protein HBZS_100700 [Helicobacter bizzozeronii CCUG 35545]|nr:hypothetical protein HBZS_100700 [Helicobacter bizzozeronii CCUG 35545]
MKHIDFIKEASDSLTEWIQVKRDRGLVCALSNDFTNVVVCDQQDGFKTPNAANDPVENLTQLIQPGDTMSAKAIRSLENSFISATAMIYVEKLLTKLGT